MFVDASAIVAILKREDGHADLVRKLERGAVGMTSAIAEFESVLALMRSRRPGDRATVEGVVREFLDRLAISIVPINEGTGVHALDAHARYGKGSGHPAGLNLGDCFAYAVAKQRGVPLLYKGDDFAETDLA
jgi:ribonuclease VapC